MPLGPNLQYLARPPAFVERTASPARPSVTVGPAGRILALSAAWFSDGAERRAKARRSRQCVECARPLASGRSPYCSSLCQYKFHGHYFWDSARIYVKRRDRYTCASCHRRYRSRDLDVDHIVEIARGGAALEYSNLQTLCRPCHRIKTSAFLRNPASGDAGTRTAAGG